MPTTAQVRDELHDLVVRDLLGPQGGPDEEFDERPTERYLLGRLAPNGTVLEPDQHEEPATAERAEVGEGENEPSAPNIPSLAPSSLGCTLLVSGETSHLDLTGVWASYLRADRPEGGRIWRRTPQQHSATLELREGQLEQRQLSEHPRVVVTGRARRHDGDWLVSVFLVNTTPRPKDLVDAAWLFQVELTVTGPDGAAVFLPRGSQLSGGDEADRNERRRLAMAYRFSPEFAVGHGTAVEVTTSETDPMRAVRVRTSAAPSYEIPATAVPDAERDPDLPELADLVLEMGRLAELDRPALVTALRPLVTGYRGWIERQQSTLADPAAHLADYGLTAREALRDAEAAADRIEAGIEVLERDDRALTAFRFANYAMHLQRAQTLAAAKRRKNDQLSLDEALAQIGEVPSWRPFQLAFLLLNLTSVADPAHPERSEGEGALTDLLWFPTGGGKTEAYLGLTAFTLAIRRLSEPLGGCDPGQGVAVLMRYTLRLLTIQQFQRATALLCACEAIRREDPKTWGAEPFRIGLWVGARVTPNRTDDAISWLNQLKKTKGGAPRGNSSPHQLTSCPWCGAKISPGRDIDVDPVLRRTLVRCPDVFCPFAEGDGLPVVLVDEEIYRLLPSLIIATVDKFAQLPWRGETQALFGQVRMRCTRHGYVSKDLLATDWESHRHQAKGSHPAARIENVSPLRPPDLIIQDELHLISGPLGSLVGLYETAVDRLATWELAPGRAVRPKVIASTATVRRAAHQITALFGRQTKIFPPPGLDIGDNFFARQRPTAETATNYVPGRRYVGVCAHGTRIRSTLIRVYIAVLGAAQKLHVKYGRNEVTDPYMTLVGYFNSLRDLGSMRRLVEDDVSARLARADERGLARRPDPLPKELTSRLSSTDIPEVLELLERSFGPKQRGRPVDVLLATNMIAVGVDVSRLGVMVVANQPKSAAEYIQASSRVGRQHPGLIFTVYNWARPRDLSHYEKFEHFHATIYRHVEALSVTPYAARAVDRGATGVLVSLVRHLDEQYNSNLDAGKFNRNGSRADHVVGVIRRRASQVGGDEARVERLLELRLDRWETERKVPARRLAYSARTPGMPADAVGFLHGPDEGRWRWSTCPTSLRDVEAGIQLLLQPDDLHDRSFVADPPFVPVQLEEEQP